MVRPKMENVPRPVSIAMRIARSSGSQGRDLMAPRRPE
jgi:hypothetical protein